MAHGSTDRLAERTPDVDARSRARAGRPIDHGRDGVILDSALAVLAESGYDGLTIDLVAARATADIATLARVIPMMCLCRAIQREPITHAFSSTLVDAVVIPALRGSGQSRVGPPPT